jgi:hypothetical protein
MSLAYSTTAGRLAADSDTVSPSLAQRVDGAAKARALAAMKAATTAAERERLAQQERNRLLAIEAHTFPARTLADKRSEQISLQREINLLQRGLDALTQEIGPVPA